MQISITDLSGREVFSQKVDKSGDAVSIALETSTLPKGTFVIRAVMDHFESHKRFIKN